MCQAWRIYANNNMHLWYGCSCPSPWISSSLSHSGVSLFLSVYLSSVVYLLRFLFTSLRHCRWAFRPDLAGTRTTVIITIDFMASTYWIRIICMNMTLNVEKGCCTHPVAGDNFMVLEFHMDFVCIGFICFAPNSVGYSGNFSNFLRHCFIPLE